MKAKIFYSNFKNALWPGAYIKGLTIPKDLRQRGTFGGPYKKKNKNALAYYNAGVVAVKVVGFAPD
jgi:hypothetical protein